MGQGTATNLASRRSFLKAAGASVLGAAIFSSLNGQGTAIAFAEERAADKGITDFETDIASAVFPCDVRFMPIIDAPTEIDRQGEIAFVLEDIPEEQVLRTEDTDVLVAGCGITGACAALAASDDGKTQVLCLEKMSAGRGMFEGMGIVGGKVMEEAGNNVDKAEMMDHMRRAAYYRVPVDPIKLWVNRSGEACDWLQEKFDEGNGEITMRFAAGAPNAHGYEVPQTEIRFASPQWSEQTKSLAGGAGLMIVKDLSNTISKRSNVTLRYNNPVVKLERNEQGRVSGAICKDAEGYYRVNAKNGVVLATGGFDASPQLLKAWCRAEDICNSASSCPNYGTTGDGQLMGIAIGAQMDPLPAAVMNFDLGSPETAWSPVTGVTPLVVGGLMINEKGRRFASESLPLQCRGNAISAQKHYGESCWRIGSSLQVSDDAQLEALRKYEEKGWAFEAESLAELARQINVPAEELEESVRRFNGFVDAGKDEDFNRPMENAKKVEGDFYYAITHQSSFLATVSGLVVDYDCHVLDYDNEVIPGLYAAGNASGGFFSGNYPRHIFGPSVGRCVTFGYVSGKNAAEEV